MKTIVRNALKCARCFDVIESVRRHDFRWCKCGAVFVDGGKDYIRRGGDFEAMISLDEFAGSDETPIE
jgi:hypothetical protein